MKTLIEHVTDLRAAAELLREQAESLEQLAIFFSGVSPTKNEVVKPKIKEIEKKERKVTGSVAGSRKLNIEEKDSIRKDWNALGEHQRTKVNRAALARKYQCSTTQVFAITRSPEYFQMMNQKKHEKKVH